MKAARVLAPALLCAFCGCAPAEDSGLLLKIAVSPTPATIGPARILVSLDGPAGPVAGATVVIRGRAPEDDTSGAPPATAREQAPGRYVVEAYAFPVSGTWTLEGTARLPDGSRATAVHEIRVVGPPS